MSNLGFQDNCDAKPRKTEEKQVNKEQRWKWTSVTIALQC